LATRRFELQQEDAGGRRRAVAACCDRTAGE
jgi:hypothetical protein